MDGFSGFDLGVDVRDYREELDVRKIAEILNFADELADHSRATINKFKCDDYETVNKADEAGPVSILDYEVERIWKSLIKKRFPNHSIMGEETGMVRGSDDFLWLLDPIDGTDDLIRGIPLFGSIIAVLYRGFPIVGVIDHPKLTIRCKAGYGLGSHRNGNVLNLNEDKRNKLSDVIVMPAYADLRYLENNESVVMALNRAFPNQRVYRNVYGHTMVAAGKLAACLEVNVSPWDIAASQLIIEESNSKFVSLQVGGVDYKKERVSALFGRVSVINRMLAIIIASATRL